MGHFSLSRARVIFILAILYRVVAAEHAALSRPAGGAEEEHKAGVRALLSPLQRVAYAAKAVTALVRLPAPSRAVLDRLLETAAQGDIESNTFTPPAAPMRPPPPPAAEEDGPPSTLREGVQRLSKYFEDSVEAHNRKAHTRALSSSAHSHSSRYDARAAASDVHAEDAHAHVDETISAHTAAGAAAAAPLAAAARTRSSSASVSVSQRRMPTPGTPQWVNVASLARRDAAIAHLHTPAAKLWQWFRSIGMKRVVLLDASHRPVGIITRKNMILGERAIVSMVAKEAEATMRG